MSGLADSLVARMVAQRDLLRDIDDRFGSISAQVASPDGSVCVKVDGLGTLTGLTLTPGALQLQPDALATLIVDTADRALGKINERQDCLIDELNQRAAVLQETPVTLWDGTIVERP